MPHRRGLYFLRARRRFSWAHTTASFILNFTVWYISGLCDFQRLRCTAPALSYWVRWHYRLDSQFAELLILLFAFVIVPFVVTSSLELNCWSDRIADADLGSLCLYLSG